MGCGAAYPARSRPRTLANIHTPARVLLLLPTLSQALTLSRSKVPLAPSQKSRGFFDRLKGTKVCLPVYGFNQRVFVALTRLQSTQPQGKMLFRSTRGAFLDMSFEEVRFFFYNLVISRGAITCYHALVLLSSRETRQADNFPYSRQNLGVQISSECFSAAPASMLVIILHACAPAFSCMCGKS
jgi:hypothetical protein